MLMGSEANIGVSRLGAAIDAEMELKKSIFSSMTQSQQYSKNEDGQDDGSITQGSSGKIF